MNVAKCMQIIPYLRSKSFDTRTAASSALSNIFSLVPEWQPIIDEELPKEEELAVPDYSSFSLQDLMQKGTLLLASSGKEFVRPTAILANSIEVKKARQEAMSRLGLDFLEDVSDEMDLDVLAAESDAVEKAPEDVVIVKQENGTQLPTPIPSPMDVDIPEIKKENGSRSGSAMPSPAAEPPEPDDDSNLSARERNRLKRKRKLGNSAFVHAPPPQASGSKYTATPGATSNKYEIPCSLNCVNLLQGSTC